MSKYVIKIKEFNFQKASVGCTMDPMGCGPAWSGMGEIKK